jgi:signal peptidase I
MMNATLRSKQWLPATDFAESSSNHDARIVNGFEALVFGPHPHWACFRALTLTLTAAFLFKYALIPMKVVGDSMAPTYASGTLNMVNRLAYQNTLPSQGDVVAITSKIDGATMVKRIIGLPGNIVSMRGGSIRLNNIPLEEPYVENSLGWCMEPTQLKANEYWVIGDNRNISIYGTVTFDTIIGKVML